MGQSGRSRRRFLTIATVVLAIAFGPMATAADPPVGLPIAPVSVRPVSIGTLSTSRPVINFAGRIHNNSPLPLVNVPLPVVCLVFCREFRFTAATTAPFLVSVRDATRNVANGWDIYVYGPARTLVGSAIGIGADGQAVEVHPTATGRYQIFVTFTYAEDPAAHYLGEVRLVSGPSWTPAGPTCAITVSHVTACFNLPVLRTVPANDLHVGGLPPVASTPLGFPLPVSAPTANSCYLDETLGLGQASAGNIQHRVTRCLRFTSDVQNVGAGNFDIGIPWLTSDFQSAFVPGQCHTQQFVQTTAGQTVARPGGECQFHLQHAHFHYRDLVAFSLHNVAVGGGIGTQTGRSLKESFCLADDDYFGFGTGGPNGPRNYIGQPGCNVPRLPAVAAPGPGTPSLVVEEGITPGWGDVYTWDTPGQFIDISNLAPGIYDLVEKTNPGGSILVAGPQQTCALTQLRLTPTAVQLLSTTDSVPCP